MLTDTMTNEQRAFKSVGPAMRHAEHILNEEKS